MLADSIVQNVIVQCSALLVFYFRQMARPNQGSFSLDIFPPALRRNICTKAHLDQNLLPTYMSSIFTVFIDLLINYTPNVKLNEILLNSGQELVPILTKQ